MCGIVAATSKRDVVDLLMSGLQALEYRGYDSAGLSVLSSGKLSRRRTKGKVADLRGLLESDPLGGMCGIAHTRWATHGAPSKRNAHPMVSGERVALVHNGIIENHEALRRSLTDQGYAFDSDTDTEVIVHLVDSLLSEDQDLFGAVQAAVKQLKGAYAIAAICVDEPGRIVGAREGSPMVLGLGGDEFFLASDIYPLLPLTNSFIYLEEGDVVALEQEGYTIRDADGHEADRPTHKAELSADSVQRGGHKHYMLKEIYEQPQAVEDTLADRIGPDRVTPNIFGVGAEEILSAVDHVHMVACGTAFHAGLVARYQLEQLAGIPCTAEVASEYRYRQPVVPPNALFVTVSQSGETADTLAALRHAKKAGYLATLAVCNVPESSIVREADLVLMTRAGPEIGVASTKAFTTQLVALQLLVIELARVTGLDAEHQAALVSELASLPDLLREALELDDEIAALAEDFADKEHALFLGRGSHYPIAMEGALKLKEISYIHAEAYAAGELKHGPLALVDDEMPVVAVAPNNRLLEKLVSNIEEVKARGGQLYVIADADAQARFNDRHGRLLKVKTGGALIAPVVLTIPLQLLAYHVAVARGTDVDQPRNLAKSVTVE